MQIVHSFVVYIGRDIRPAVKKPCRTWQATRTECVVLFASRGVNK